MVYSVHNAITKSSLNIFLNIVCLFCFVYIFVRQLIDEAFQDLNSFTYFSYKIISVRLWFSELVWTYFGQLRLDWADIRFVIISWTLQFFSDRNSKLKLSFKITFWLLRLNSPYQSNNTFWILFLILFRAWSNQLTS